MRLGVEAALVDGLLVPGDVEIADGVDRRDRPRGRNGRGDRLARLRRPPGERLRRRRPARDRRARATGSRRRGAARDRRHGVPPDLHHRARGRARRRARARCRRTRTAGPRILGVHVEGPFLSPTRVGTHPLASPPRPRPGAARAASLAPGPVVLVTLAPELPGRGRADRPPARARRHRLAAATPTRPPTRPTPPSTAASARSRTSSTRCGPSATATRASPARRSRGPTSSSRSSSTASTSPPRRRSSSGGPPAAASRSSRTRSRARASSDGSYSLGGVEVEVRDGVARGPDGVLAGSALTMIEAVRNLHALGVPLADALGAATAVPARVIGRADVGRLGRRAAARTWSCSTTTSRSSACSSEATSVSSA